MDPHPDDLTGTADLTLMQAARTGDRLAFGVLYLRHHGAAWRIACVASRFSPDAELAVIEGFTRVFSALPAESEEFEAGEVTFRPYLLACVRQAALDRARSAGRAEPDSTRHRGRAGHPPASPPPPAPLAGLTPDGEIVLSSLEHHVARGALAALPERSRTALWLSDVEAMTPREVAGILGSHPDAVAALTSEARAGMRATQGATQGRHEVRADCRFTVHHLGAYHADTLDPKKGVLVRSHLDLCPPCGMRLGELANAPAALAAAVPAAPLLGGETQHHWLTSVAEIHPAERLLPPGLAAAAPIRRFPIVLHRRVHTATADRRPEADTADPLRSPGWTRVPGASGSPVPSLPPSWTIPPGRAATPRRPGRDRRTRRLVLAAGLPVVIRQTGRAAWPAVPAMALLVAWLGVMLALPQLMQPETAPGPSGLALPAVQAYVPNYFPGAKPGSARPRSPQPPLPIPAVGVTGGGNELAAEFTSESGRSRAGSVVEDDGPTVTLEALPVVVTTAVPVAPLLVAAPPPSEDSKPREASKSKKDPTARKAQKPRQEAKPDRKSEPDEKRKRSKIVAA